MNTTNVALYEALKPSIGEEAARMIAEVIPPARDLATTGDLREATADLRGEMHAEFASVRGEMHAEFASVRGEMREGFASVRAEMHAESKHNLRWIIGLFVPVWFATWGTMVTVLLKL